MTETQRAVLAAMQIGVPITAAEISRALGQWSPSSIGAICARLAALGYVRSPGDDERNEPRQYTKLMEAPVRKDERRQINFHRSGEARGINRVSLPIEPWRVGA